MTARRRTHPDGVWDPESDYRGIGFEPDTGQLDTGEYGTTLAAHSGIRESDQLSRDAKGLAHALLSRAKMHAEEGWTCFPGAGTLAIDTGMSRRQVFYALNELLNAGLIAITDGWTASNHYVLNCVAMAALTRANKPRKQRRHRTPGR